jgi:hypothetical protein
LALAPVPTFLCHVRIVKRCGDARYAPPVPGVWNAVSADDSNETVAGPTGGGNPEAGTPTGRRTTEVFGSGRMEREWSKVQRRGAGAEGASLNT